MYYIVLQELPEDAIHKKMGDFRKTSILSGKLTYQKSTIWRCTTVFPIGKGGISS